MPRKSRAVIIFGTLAIVFLLCAALSFWYYTSLPTSISYEKQGSWYIVNVPKAGWYDPGVWVAPWHLVMASGEDQPFTIAVDSYQKESNLRRSGAFHAQILTADAERKVNQDEKELRGERVKVAYVSNQGKIYIRTDKGGKVAFAIQHIEEAYGAEAASIRQELQSKEAK